MPLRQPLQVLSLSPSGKLLAAACGNRLQIVDVENNAILAASDDTSSHAKKCMIRHLIWCGDAKLVSNAEDKVVKEWRLQPATTDSPAALVLEQQRGLAKRANALSITDDGETLVIADKFGDVYAFPMFGCSPTLPTPPAPTFAPEASTSTNVEKEATPEGSASEKPWEGKTKNGKRRKVGNTGGVAPEWRHVPAKIATVTPVIGHVSMLTALMVLSNQGKIITADRDEHIRVSKWPQGWEIEHFLMGQRKFVSSLLLHPLDPNILITAGGDETIRLWDLTTYKCTRKDVSVRPLLGTAEIIIEIPITAPGRRPRKWVKEAAAKEAAEMQKNALQTDQAAGESNEAAEVPEQPEDTKQDTPASIGPYRPPGFIPKVRKLDLGITQMVSVGGDSEEGGAFVVVSSVGSSALLAWPAKALLDTSAAPPSQFLDLGSPVLSITANKASTELWVSLDVSNAPERPAVEVLHVSNEGLVPFAHSVLAILREGCSSPVTADSPYPTVQALFPDTALLSKQPKELSGGREGEGGDDEQELAEEDAEA